MIRKTVVVAAFGLFGLASVARGQGFDSGSNGSFGPINVPAGTTQTIPLPPDGVIHATTVTLNGGNSTLRFTRNALNTPVYLLATGDVILAGTISVSGGAPTATTGGQGGPGGFDGGDPSIAGSEPGDGKGPGGGRAGAVPGGGSYGSRYGCAECGAVYGSLLLFPMLGGPVAGGRPAAAAVEAEVAHCW